SIRVSAWAHVSPDIHGHEMATSANVARPLDRTTSRHSHLPEGVPRPEPSPFEQRYSPRRRATRRFMRHTPAMVGLSFLIFIAVIAIILPMLVSLDATRIDLTTKASQPPGPGHLLGTDPSNRDNLARLVFGARTSLTVGFGAVAVSLLIGVTLGLLAGYYGGNVDQVIGRLADIVLSVPSLLMIIVFVSLVGPSIQSVIVVVALLTWPGACRLVRGQILSLREAEFITAARAIGVNDRRIVFRHLLPNTY